MDRDRAAVEAQSVAVADQAKAWIREAQRRKAARDQVAGDQRPPAPSESRAARLKAMRIAWERRGRPWDEAEAVRVLAELEVRGETRAYGPGGTTYR